MKTILALAAIAVLATGCGSSTGKDEPVDSRGCTAQNVSDDVNGCGKSGDDVIAEAERILAKTSTLETCELLWRSDEDTLAVLMRALQVPALMSGFVPDSRYYDNVEKVREIDANQTTDAFDGALAEYIALSVVIAEDSLDQKSTHLKDLQNEILTVCYDTGSPAAIRNTAK